MRSFVFACIAMVTGALLVGCVGPVDSDDVDVAPPARQKLGGGGSTGVNGLGDEDYDVVEHSLLAALNVAVVRELGHDVNPFIAADLLQSQAGIRVFDYAVQCGVERDYEIYNGYYQKFTGMGHMATTKHWRVEGLDMDGQNDLLSCMVAHINPKGIHVPILLEGLSVEEDNLDHEEYRVPEAMWLTKRNVDGTPYYIAWPSEEMVKRCEGNPYDALKNRVCGQNPGACKLHEGNQGDCQWDDGQGGWTCLGKPALLTYLKEADFKNMYIDCN